VQVGARFELRFPQKEQKKTEANGDKGPNRARRPRPQRRTRRKVEEGVTEETRPV
jgi:hypothetical protein